jgi:hypothetical protein
LDWPPLNWVTASGPAKSSMLAAIHASSAATSKAS